MASTQTSAAPATSATPARGGRLLLIHGYSANGTAFLEWKKALGDVGFGATEVAVGNYITLNNEVTIKDLGEAFDRALRYSAWSTDGKDDTWTFDAIVHSTGMLVVRQWLVSDPFKPGDPRSRVRRLKHLIGLAPATFGSPQAKQGRSWLGALVKGNRSLFGPDFLNAGNRVLDGLELASSYTWNLTERDMLCQPPLYDKGPNTPYVAVFVGDVPYSGVDAVANSPGCDGTVRWAGCALNTRKVTVDFRREPKLVDRAGNPVRCNISDWAETRLAAPMIAVQGKNHGTILSDPDPGVAQLIARFLSIADDATYAAWETDALAFGAPGLAKMNSDSLKDGVGGAGWQQLVVHAMDDHGDGVTDYNLQLYIGESLDDSKAADFQSVPAIVDCYSGDASYRCFYLRLDPKILTMNTVAGQPYKMWLELVASSGSSLLEYEAYTDSPDDPHSLTINHQGGAPVKIEITALAQGENSLIYPYTTTLLELVVEREPLPLKAISTIFGWEP